MSLWKYRHQDFLHQHFAGLSTGARNGHPHWPLPVDHYCHRLLGSGFHHCRCNSQLVVDGRLRWRFLYPSLHLHIPTAHVSTSSLEPCLRESLLMHQYRLMCYLTKKHAMIADRPWSPGMIPFSNRVDSWKDASRWKRGLAPLWYVKVFLFVIFLAALATSGLGCYAGIEGIISAFNAAGAPTTFGCRAPGQPAGELTLSLPFPQISCS